MFKEKGMTHPWDFLGFGRISDQPTWFFQTVKMPGCSQALGLAEYAEYDWDLITRKH